MTSFEELCDRVGKFNAARDWGQFHTPKNLAMAICGEAGELAAEMQWLSPAEIELQLADEGFRESLAAEAADVLLYLVSFSRACGFDLARAALDKLQVNETRYPVNLSKGSSAKYSRLLASDDSSSPGA
ncbi:nucleotide pyrophosphohydrolase [Mycobacterium sp. NPDC050853]|uniref:nucleotide pyrophosphohydrolase n=1 Tax=Mycobacterium sp. NPDC050853 TaxID=3155160 RepID=UPI0033F73D38